MVDFRQTKRAFLVLVVGASTRSRYVAAEQEAVRGGSTTTRFSQQRSPLTLPGALSNGNKVPLPPPATTFDEDSIANFCQDVTQVLKVLRADHYDPTISSIFHSPDRPTFAVTWTHDMWEQHTSRKRFVQMTLYWYKSALLKRILPQLSVLMIWTGVVIYWQQRTSGGGSSGGIHFPLTSLSMVSGFVASLLALRTNQGMSRLLEALSLIHI